MEIKHMDKVPVQRVLEYCDPSLVIQLNQSMKTNLGRYNLIGKYIFHLEQSITFKSNAFNFSWILRLQNSTRPVTARLIKEGCKGEDALLISLAYLLFNFPDVLSLHSKSKNHFYFRIALHKTVSGRE